MNALRNRLPATDASAPLPARFLTAFQRFFHTESASGIVLLACTVLALAWANSPWRDSYFALWHTELTIGPLTLDAHHWINDALMALFFLLVGLEIKRELLAGELRSLRQAMLPVFGALGGMLFPAVIYAVANRGTENLHGWGVPVATDIAFALAVLALLGPRVPAGLKIFLAALAIADDIGAVIVIALFYTSELNLTALLIAGGGLACAAAMGRLGVIQALPYALIGVVVWVAVLQSGVHASVAGVLLAFTIPAQSRIDAGSFYRAARKLLRRFEHTISPAEGEQDEENIHTPELRLTAEQTDLLTGLRHQAARVTPPLDHVESALHGWVAFGVMPLFALSNAGVSLPPNALGVIASPVSLGIILGLVLGKQLGVTLLAWLAVKLKLAALPEGVTWRHVYGVAWVCGIGFTMSLFVANLAFGVAGPQLDSAKLGVLCASLISGVGGYLLLRSAGTAPLQQPAAAAAPGPAAID